MAGLGLTKPRTAVPLPAELLAKLLAKGEGDPGASSSYGWGGLKTLLEKLLAVAFSKALTNG